MYRPPENSNRVKSIKSKFENPDTQKNGARSDLTRQVSDPARRNVKRTPAFRLEINSEKSFERSNTFNRSFYAEKVRQFKHNCDKKVVQRDEQEKENCSKPVLIKSKSSLDFSVIRSKFEDETNRSEVKIEEVTKNISCLYTQPLPKASRAQNLKENDRNTADVVNELYSKNCDTSGLTDTLKAALKRPLPDGPAPQKPPRTFEHTPKTDISKNTSFLHHHKKPSDKLPKKSEAKHDPRYMLNKLESALRNNKIRVRKPVKIEASTTSGEDSDDSVLFKSKSQSRVPPIPSPTQSFNFNCLNGLTGCRVTYETIREPNSSFFVSCEEPIYDEPFHFSQDDNKTEILKNLKNEEKSTKRLYYMSTSLLCNEDNGCILKMDENSNREDNEIARNVEGTAQKQVPADDSSQSSALSDLGSAASTPVDGNDSFETSVKHLIDTFETRSSRGQKKPLTEVPSDGPNRIEELKLSLQKTLERCFDHDKESSDELREKKVSVDSMINKFQTYVKTMPKYKKPKVGQEDRLFYCCLVVGWDREKPKIKFRYPPNVKIPDRIEDLCYPEAASGPLDISGNAQCYSLVITNDKGERTFGYCRRVIPEGSTKCIPLAYCILSKHRAPRFYKKILIELESRHGIPDKLRDELISRFYHNKFPRPGESLKLDLNGFLGDFYHTPHERGCTNRDSDCDLTTFVHVDVNGGYGTINDRHVKGDVSNSPKTELTLTLHHDTRYEEADLKPLHKLPPNILLKIFASLLLERKVILISCVISKLSSCVDALQSILYPFSWPHTFIPILPQCLWDVVESPTPVICGILSVSVVNDHKIEHGIVVDLDECGIICEEGDENSILSGCMKKAWLQGLDLANEVPPNDYVHSVYLSDAYIKVFIVSLKHYKNHIVNNSFEKEAFIKNAKSKGIRRFLKWFTETTMFVSFIDSVINSPDSFNLFDKKIEMYGSDESNLIISKLREWRKT